MSTKETLCTQAGVTDLVCIVCPLGCSLTATPAASGSGWQVTGNRCPRGLDYALAELTDPRRVLTTTVTAVGGDLRRLPVKTAQPFPKALLREAAARLACMQVAAPVEIGAVVVSDLLGTGIDVVATRNLARAGGEPPR